MRRSSFGTALITGFGVSALVATTACGGTSGNDLFGLGDGGADGSQTNGEGGVIVLGRDGGTGMLGGGGADGAKGDSSTTESVCPAGLMCNVSCTGGGTTTITGKVYDPAGKDPLYGVAVYVPAVPLTQLPRGVPTGSAACNCGALFESGAVTNTTTAVDGSFTLKNVPVGTGVPLVLQVGKWRRSVKVNVTACTDNAQPGNTLTLPGTIPAGDIEDNMPDIAVSTGSADTLECLLLRMGVPAAEYVAGTSTAGHVHIFSGGDTGGGFGGGGGGGTAEANPMPGAPASSTALWGSQAQLMPFDVVLLSCEGGETYDAQPAFLENYLNAGGRVFASHYHYSWFSGPLDSSQSYTAPSDWGTNLATWTADSSDGNGPIGGVIQTTLNGSTMPFQKGLNLSTWLDENGALGTNMEPPTELAIYQPRYNARVGAANTPSQAWIAADPSTPGESGATMYFSFDTPVGAPIPAGGTSPAYCGRAVFSDLHVNSDTTVYMTPDTGPPPGGCVSHPLTPQEKALEFMLFDLSSCVLPDTVAPPVDAGLPPPSIPK